MELAIAFIIGLLIGLAGLLWLRGRGMAERATLASRAEQAERFVDETRRMQAEREALFNRLQAENGELKAEAAKLAAQLAAEQAAAAEKIALLSGAEQKLADAFQALSAEALKSNNQAFLELAKQNLATFQETAKGDLEARKQAVDVLVKPIHEALEKLGLQTQEIERQRTGAYASLTEQVKGLMLAQDSLKQETGRLVRALHRPEVRGRWGEVQLKRVVEMAGMQAHCDFFEQETAEADGRRQRPDMLVKLPGGKSVVLDSKAPIAAFLEAAESETDEARGRHIKQFARHVREHVKELGAKAYWDQFQPSPEFVVLFLPGEAFFSAALQEDPQLIEYANEHRVILATPTTLLALLKAVYFGWRQESLAENARKISELGKELYERLGVMAGHWSSVGKNLMQATEAYNKATGSLETRVLVSARRFQELQAATEAKEIVTPVLVESVPRQLQSAELTPPEEDEAIG
ncbi:MAG: DNA recombination protein RmuC [Hydrogenophilaceae bacterium]|nr:DNA recombination protein RmuC [Hydrogenophilaceae bacterium]